MYRVRSCETMRPPTTARPSGRRDSAPAPKPIAIGRVPISAAIVVIMMGRKRIIGALIDCIQRRLAPYPLRLKGKVDHHDRILLDYPQEHDDSDKGIDIQVLVKKHECYERPEPGSRKSGENGEGMNKAFVEDSQNNIDDQQSHYQ